MSDLASRSPQWQLQPPEDFGNSEKCIIVALGVLSVQTYPSQGVRALRAGFCLQSWQE